MEVGAVTESVEVTGQLPYINTDSPEVGANLNRADLLDVPLSISGGRYPEALAYSIMPGASGGTWTSHINGSASFSKEVLLDGASVTTYMADFAETSVSVGILAGNEAADQRAIGGIRAQPGGLVQFRSEVGEQPGARQRLLCACAMKRWTPTPLPTSSAAAPRAIDRLFDYAFSFGGPIYIPKVYNGKNRSFFYTTYERYKQRAIGPGAPTQSFPTPDEYAGNFSALLGPATGQTDALGNPVYRGSDLRSARPSPSCPAAGGSGLCSRATLSPRARISKVSKTISAMALACCLPTVKDASGNYPLINNAVQSAQRHAALRSIQLHGESRPDHQRPQPAERFLQLQLSAALPQQQRRQSLGRQQPAVRRTALQPELAADPQLAGARVLGPHHLAAPPQQFHGVLQPHEQPEFQPADHATMAQGVGHCEHRQRRVSLGELGCGPDLRVIQHRQQPGRFSGLQRQRAYRHRQLFARPAFPQGGDRFAPQLYQRPAARQPILHVQCAGNRHSERGGLGRQHRVFLRQFPAGHCAQRRHVAAGWPGRNPPLLRRLSSRTISR